MKAFFTLLYSILLIFIITACSSTKFVPDGRYLLNDVKIKSDAKVLKSDDLMNYVAQVPNFRTFTVYKFPLFVYNLSGQDSTKWINRTLRKAGEPPVLLDTLKIAKSIENLQALAQNKGYYDAEINADVIYDKKKANVIYNIKANAPYRIKDYTINIPDSVIEKPDTLFITGMRPSRMRIRTIPLDSLVYRNSLIKKGDRLDADVLDAERTRVAEVFGIAGYYAFNKDYIEYDVDTLNGKNNTDVNTLFKPSVIVGRNNTFQVSKHIQYEVTEVKIYVDYDPIKYGHINEFTPSSIYTSGNQSIYYGERGRFIRPNILLSHCFIKPGYLYNEKLTSLTYTSLSQLKILKNVNISYQQLGGNKLLCLITAVPEKKQRINTNLDATNSGGFFGLGAGIGYMHRNLFKGSEVFTAGLKGSYEMVTPSFSNFDDNYFEIGGEVGLTFPRFMLPFLKRDFRRTIIANTSFNTAYTFQRRPGFFTRTVFSTGINYTWNSRVNNGIRHALNLIEVNYIHLPDINQAFKDKLSIGAQKYSFSDQFIVSTSYTFSKSNVEKKRRITEPIYYFRTSIESAGNALSLIAKLTNQKKNAENQRELFGTQFAQYLKGTIDYSRTHFVDDNNSVAWRVGAGLAYPYGNFEEIPISKRFFSGGGNSIRGWAVRSLGPGSFRPKIVGDRDYDNFFYHSGDIKLDLNIEYRSRLFWIVELATFIDAGNIWTVKSSKDTPNGQFKLNKFYEQIALAWGLGLRFDFNYFLLRLDMGWKAFDPQGNGPNGEKTVRWPIKDPLNIKDNTAFHIAIGYPF